MIYFEGKELKAVNQPPSKYKSKAIYFVKHAATKLDMENMTKQVSRESRPFFCEAHDQVTTMDLSETPLEQLKLLFEKIYLPILSNPANQKGLPKLMAHAVTQRLHKSISDRTPRNLRS